MILIRFDLPPYLYTRFICRLWVFDFRFTDINRPLSIILIREGSRPHGNYVETNLNIPCNYCSAVSPLNLPHQQFGPRSSCIHHILDAPNDLADIPYIGMCHFRRLLHIPGISVFSPFYHVKINAKQNEGYQLEYQQGNGLWTMDRDTDPLNVKWWYR